MMAISVPTRIALMSAYSLLLLLGFFGNMSVVFLILTSKRFRKSISSILIANLALADFFVCLVSAPYFISSLLIPHPEKPGREQLDSICKAFVVFAYALGFTRILLLTIISIERFIAIIHPFFYQTHCALPLPNIRVFVICICPWIYSFLSTSPAGIMHGWGRYEGKVGKHCGYAWEDANLGFVLPLFIMNFILPLAVIVYTNCKVYFVARRQRRCIAACFGVISPTRASRATCMEANLALKEKMVQKDDKERKNKTFLFENIDKRYFKDRDLKIGTEEIRLDRFEPVFDENGSQKSGYLSFDGVKVLNLPESNIENKFPSSCSNTSEIARRTSEKASDEVVWIGDDLNIGNPESTDVQRPFRLSVSSKLEDSGFKDESTGRYSYLFNGTGDSNRSKTGSSVFRGNSFAGARSRLSRLMQLSRNSKDTSITTNQKRTKDFVVFFSTLSVVTLFLCTWLPFVIVSIFIMTTDSLITEKIDLIVSMITIIDSAFTPFIVLGTRREFRKKLLQKLCRLTSD